MPIATCIVAIKHLRTSIPIVSLDPVPGQCLNFYQEELFIDIFWRPLSASLNIAYVYANISGNVNQLLDLRLQDEYI
jgi:hypothetical protein